MKKFLGIIFLVFFNVVSAAKYLKIRIQLIKIFFDNDYYYYKKLS